METIDDIVKDVLKEVRESEMNNPDKTTKIFLTSSNMALRDFACRAKKAAKWIAEGLNDGIVERDQHIAKLTAENERLKAALQPVLDIVMDSATSDLSMELAIGEAKRIYNEGTAK